MPKNRTLEIKSTRRKVSNSIEIQTAVKRLREIEPSEGIMTRGKRRRIEEALKYQNNDEEKDDENKNDEKKCTISIVLKRLTKADFIKAGMLPNEIVSNESHDKSTTTNNSWERETGTTINVTETTIAKPDFAPKEIVWAKIRGFPHWPAKISCVTTTANGKIMYEVKWYNDYRCTKIHKMQVFKFLENFEKFSSKFDEVIGLKTAAFEALYEYRQHKMK